MTFWYPKQTFIHIDSSRMYPHSFSPDVCKCGYISIQEGIHIHFTLTFANVDTSLFRNVSTFILPGLVEMWFPLNIGRNPKFTFV